MKDKTFDDIRAAVEKHRDYICEETLADSIQIADEAPAGSVPIVVDGVTVWVYMEVVDDEHS